MSWVNKIETNIEITTGDGKVYQPIYVITSKSIDYNFAEFVFVEIKGTLVKRELAKGARHTWELTFQGENHLDVALEFEQSADDRRPWRVYHPMFGNLLVQPTKITIDPSGINTTKISVDVVETISEEAPRIDQDPTDKTTNDALNLKDVSAESFAANVQPDVGDVNQMQNDVNVIYEEGSANVLSGDAANEYFNKFNDALTKTINAASDPLAAASATIDLIYIPADFVTDLKGRLNIFRNQLIKLTEKIDGLVEPNSKSIFETNAGAIIGGMIKAAANPIEGDFGSKNSVLEVIEFIMNDYNGYISNIDSLQTSNGGGPSSYVPDYNAQNALNSLVNYAVSQLFNIATAAAQERTVILEADSNVINLAHRFYGLEIDDATINRFIDQNNIGANEYLVIKKGRKLSYFI